MTPDGRYTLRDLPAAYRGGTAYALHRATTATLTAKQLLRMIADARAWLDAYQPGVAAQAHGDLRHVADLLAALADNLHDRMLDTRKQALRQAARYARDQRAQGHRGMAHAIIWATRARYGRLPRT